MPELETVVPWLAQAISESRDMNARLLPIGPRERMIGDVPENIRPLFLAARWIDDGMSHAMREHEAEILGIDDFVRLQKELDILRQRHDAITALFWASVRAALDIHGGLIGIREEWTAVELRREAGSSSSELIVVDGNVGKLFGELVRTAEEP